jgi:membrane protein
LIAENINQVLAARGSVGLIGLLGLAWAAMGVFTVLVRNISRAWPDAKVRNIFKMRLMALVMLTGLIGGLLTLFVVNTVTAFLPQDVNHVAEKATSSRFFSDLAMGVLLFFILLVLYHWLPGISVRWRDITWGALVSAISIAIVTRVFTWYLGSGLSTYNLIYGSLGAIVALLFWIYMLSLIIFVGAHLSASIAYCKASPPDGCGPTAGGGSSVEESE